MSRMIALIAFALLASTVSAQTSNLWFYAGSTNCTSPQGAVVVNTTVPTTNTCTLVNNTAVQNTYVKAVCNSTTGVVTVTLFNQDSLCNATSANGTVSSAQCNLLGTSNSLSVQQCTIVSPATPTPSYNTTTPTPSNNGTTPTPSPLPGNATNPPTVKPGSASQQAGLSMIAAAVAVMVIAMF